VEEEDKGHSSGAAVEDKGLAAAAEAALTSSQDTCLVEPCWEEEEQRSRPSPYPEEDTEGERIRPDLVVDNTSMQ